jgi:hypothetical protein
MQVTTWKFTKIKSKTLADMPEFVPCIVNNKEGNLYCMMRVGSIASHAKTNNGKIETWAYSTYSPIELIVLDQNPATEVSQLPAGQCFTVDGYKGFYWIDKNLDIFRYIDSHIYENSTFVGKITPLNFKAELVTEEF